jgi:hypothetical protein
MNLRHDAMRFGGNGAGRGRIRVWATALSDCGDLVALRRVTVRTLLASLLAARLLAVADRAWPWRAGLGRWSVGAALAGLGGRLADVERRTAIAVTYLPIDKATAEQVNPGQIGEYIPPRLRAVR